MKVLTAGKICQCLLSWDLSETKLERLEADGVLNEKQTLLPKTI